MQTMQWYNPKIGAQEEVPPPITEAQAIEMLSAVSPTKPSEHPQTEVAPRGGEGASSAPLKAFEGA